MNLRDKPIEQIKDVAKFLNETAQSTNPPSETQWNEIRYDLANMATFLEAFTIPAMETPLVRHEYRTVPPRQEKMIREDRPLAVFGRKDEEAVGNA